MRILAQDRQLLHMLQLLAAVSSSFEGPYVVVARKSNIVYIFKPAPNKLVYLGSIFEDTEASAEGVPG